MRISDWSSDVCSSDLWTARPNPDQRVPLNKRKGADVEGRSPRALTVRIVDAAAVAIKFQAVIRALDVTVFQYAIAQRCEAMRADVEHCRCATIGLAVHDDRDIADPSAQLGKAPGRERGG